MTAFALEGQGYVLQGDTVVNGGLRGASLEFVSVGLNHLKLVETDELILCKRPNTSAHNLIFGTLYVDVHGTIEITNVTKNIKCVLDISRVGWSSTNNYKVEGKVLDANQVARFEVTGKWNEYLGMKDLATGKEEQVFRATPKVPNHERMYGFTEFTCNLNYINDEMRKTLPPTDTRLRPDQRLMEQAKYDEAAQEKHRLEEK